MVVKLYKIFFCHSEMRYAPSHGDVVLGGLVEQVMDACTHFPHPDTPVIIRGFQPIPSTTTITHTPLLSALYRDLPLDSARDSRKVNNFCCSSGTKHRSKSMCQYSSRTRLSIRLRERASDREHIRASERARARARARERESAIERASERKRATERACVGASPAAPTRILPTSSVFSPPPPAQKCSQNERARERERDRASESVAARVCKGNLGGSEARGMLEGARGELCSCVSCVQRQSAFCVCARCAFTCAIDTLGVKSLGFVVHGYKNLSLVPAVIWF